jgi:hypothetical protein
MSLVKVLITPLYQDHSGTPQPATGTLICTVVDSGWPATHLNGSDSPQVILPKPIVISYTDGVLAEDLYFTDIGTANNYYHCIFIDADNNITYTADVRLPQNHSAGTINWSHLQFKGAL